MKTREMNSFFIFSSLFVTFILLFENSQISFSCSPSFGLFRLVKYLNFEQNDQIWTDHQAVLEIKHLEVPKNPYYVLFLEGSLERVSAHGLYVIIKLYVI